MLVIVYLARVKNVVQYRVAAALYIILIFGSIDLAHAFDATDSTRRGIQAFNRGNYDLAFQLLKKEADAGVSDAQVNLGYMFNRGLGTNPDRDEALRLYRLAAERGNGEGWNALGERAWASGLPSDRYLAVEYFCRSIALGNRRALNNLGTRTVDEESFGPGRFVEARSLWTQASKRGNAGAMFNLGMSLATESPREATDWLLRSANLGHAPAIAALREGGYPGKLPKPIDTQGSMWIVEKGAPPGHSKYCGFTS